MVLRTDVSHIVRVVMRLAHPFNNLIRIKKCHVRVNFKVKQLLRQHLQKLTTC